jgi:hypothetical protein
MAGIGEFPVHGSVAVEASETDFPAAAVFLDLT